LIIFFYVSVPPRLAHLHVSTRPFGRKCAKTLLLHTSKRPSLGLKLVTVNLSKLGSNSFNF